MTDSLNSDSLAPEEAAERISPFLQPGEQLVLNAQAKSPNVAGQATFTGAGSGVLFVTNARILHWTVGAQEPWLSVDLANVDRVAVDVTPQRRLSPGLSRLLVTSSTPSAVVMFILETSVAQRLERDFTGTASRTGPSGSAESHPPRSGRDVPPDPGPKSSQSAARFTVPLSAIAPKDRIPSYKASLRAIRVLEPATYLANLGTIHHVAEQARQAAEHPDIQSDMARITDPLVTQLRERWEDGRLPVFDPDLIHACIALGAGVARVERDSGWTDMTTVHPSIHSALVLIGSIGDTEGPGVNVLLDAAFNAARGSTSPTQAFDG